MWRPMLAGDLALVQGIADRVHADYPEAPEIFANRLDLFPAGCFMAVGNVGYCIAHPGVVGQPPPLDTVLDGLPANADCLYLHDVALLPAARGNGLGSALVARMEQVAKAHGFSRIALTAVSNSDRFWQGLGFGPMPCAKLASYGAATYRVKVVKYTGATREPENSGGG
ncbi:MAG: GNAT family N-acetyltransferase [Rhodospirillaceae bacterium]|nr:GNAT family N-acetyltransferase [Rhodospirillales bacterium]